MVAFDEQQKAGWLQSLGHNRYGGVWLAVLLLSAIPIFWIGFVSLGDAWSTPEYSHGPIIPALSFYMFLREMRRVPSDDSRKNRLPGLLLIALALAIAIFGNLTRIPDIATYAFILWVGGVILLCFGFSRGLLFWTGVLHLVYMLPLPQFIYWKLTIWLQLVSSELGVWFIQAIGIPVFLEGNVIDLGIYKLQVAEACSGLRYLFPILSFSYVFCVLYNGPVWHKIVILLAAAPITVLMNSIRIGVIGVLVNSYGIGHAEGFLHYFEGWVIFAVCVGLLFLLAVLMQRLQRNPKPLSDTLDIDFSGAGPQLMRIFDVPLNKTLIAATLVTVAVSAIWLAGPQREFDRPERDPFGFFPLQLGNWEGVTSPLEPQVEQVLNADDYIQSTFSAVGQPAAVGFFAAYYHKQTEGSGIHSPEVCLPVGGWEMFDIKEVTVDLSQATDWPPFKTNRAIIQKGLDRMLVYYWFEQRGKRMTNDFSVKLSTVKDSLTIGRSDGALVRFTTPMGRTESISSAETRLQSLIVEVLPKLSTYLPH